MGGNKNEPCIQAKFIVDPPLQIGRCAPMSFPIVAMLDSSDHHPPMLPIQPDQFDGCEITLEIIKMVEDGPEDFKSYKSVERSKENRRTIDKNGHTCAQYVAVFPNITIEHEGIFRLLAKSHFKIDGALEITSRQMTGNIWVLNDGHPEVRASEKKSDELDYIEWNYKNLGMTEEELEDTRTSPQYKPTLSITLAPNPGTEPTH
ncbi:hypothetical protein ACJ73_03571 [Blastomyces percursus]|uniref:Uncharacterized protein n=1 Tax=Blastomyces percursus TaxID=1658174 RepID=A0A1J9QAI2_9EURO|nr:hypothetical protein ACJ73_03571 [Blastomyces percursus]